MQLAEILSDLNSLRVCDHGAALALVSSHKTLSNIPEAGRKDYAAVTPAEKKNSDSINKPSVFSLEGTENDPDLQRAIDLVDLHHGVKEKHLQGVDMGLTQARNDVNRVLEKLKVNKKASHKDLDKPFWQSH